MSTLVFPSMTTPVPEQELEISGPIEDRWQSAGGCPVLDAGAVKLGNSVYALGSGLTGQNGFARLDLDTWTWEMLPDKPSNIGGSAVALSTGEVMVCDIPYAYNPGSGAWTALAAAPYTFGRNGFYADGDVVYSLGSSSDISNYAGFAKYTRSTNSWTTLARFPSNGSAGTWWFVAKLNGNIVGMGNGGSGQMVATYNVATNTWSTVTTYPVTISGNVVGAALSDHEFLFLAGKNAFIYDDTAKGITSAAAAVYSTRINKPAVLSNGLLFLGSDTQMRNNMQMYGGVQLAAPFSGIVLDSEGPTLAVSKGETMHLYGKSALAIGSKL